MGLEPRVPGLRLALIDLGRGTRIGMLRPRFARTQWLAADALADLQDGRLTGVLAWAREAVPFYRDLDAAGSLPPAAVLACELDPMRDDAVAYTDRLRAAGVAADYHLGRGLVHGIMRARGICDEAGRFFDAICDAARRLHEG